MNRSTHALLHDDDAHFGGGLDIHVVHARSGSPDDFQIAGGVDDVSRHLGSGSHHQAVVVLTRGESRRLSKHAWLDDQLGKYTNA